MDDADLHKKTRATPGDQDHESQTPEPGPGWRLREAREQRGLSQADVAESLRLSETIIDQLEQDSVDALPPAIFVRGYLKAYAGLLELDAEPLLKSFNGRNGVPHAPPLRVIKPVQTAPDMSRGMKRMMLWGLPVLAAIASGFWGIEHYRSIGSVDAPITLSDEVDERGDDLSGADNSLRGTAEGPGLPVADEALPEVAEPDPETLFTDELAGPPEGRVDERGGSSSTSAGEESESGDGQAADSAPAPVTETQDLEPASSADDTLVLRFSGSSWVEVYDADGEPLLYGLIDETGERTLSGRAPYSVVIGDTNHVSLEHGGESVDLGIRRPGRVARLQVPR
ncbi:MAG: RodZ domain-containing protein [Aquisalimonadaceae bacterium]